MTRERENEMLAERSALRRQLSAAIQRIADARLRGERDDAAIAEVARLSQREVELTRPNFLAA